MLTNTILYNRSKRFINLSEIDNNADLHIWALHFDLQNLINKEDRNPDIHVFLTADFRNNFLSSLKKDEYIVNHPFDLSDDLKTKDWLLLEEKIKRFSILDVNDKINLFRVLRRLCFYQLILDLSNNTEINTENHFYHYEVFLAKYMLNIDGYFSFDINEMIVYALSIQSASVVKVKLWYLVCQFFVKFDFDLIQLQKYISFYYDSIQELKPLISENEYLEIISRFYRMKAFIPQLEGDLMVMSHYMDLCENFALEIQSKTSLENIYIKSILYPIYESRVKEYLIKEDYNNSLLYAQKLIDLQPYSGGGYMLLGQIYAEIKDYKLSKTAYLKSARLSPITAEIAYYMAGQCAQELNEYETAILFYKSSLDFDSTGYSNYENILEIAKEIRDESLIEKTQSILKNLDIEIETSDDQLPYQEVMFKE
ncbi:tetratricopeptide repeat protein [Flammeovirga pacifica]|uniref:Uncharacterized protein n=1 Tax=Flammeovirga pacifica TaxID=915059 RepID=A0A1S1YSY9_FLAPC|nr:hypothetical protein [Flammeovirga pacifica]OHX64147.1 hypothetical protein NH26_21315 [Flammeovirga pacifica]